MKHRLITYSLLIVCLALLLLDMLTDLKINTSFAYYSVLFIALLSGQLLAGGTVVKRSTGKALVLAFIITALCYGIMRMAVGAGEWKTQTVVYQHLEQSNRTIVFQLQDIGARGYSRRTVDRIQLLPYIDWIKAIDKTSFDSTAWKKVDLQVNELGLKGG